MPKLSPGLRRCIFTAALLPLLLLALSACGTPTPSPKPVGVPTPVAQIPQVSDTPTSLPPPTPPSSGGDAGGTAVDVSTWPKVSYTTAGTSYSYRYPPGWTPDLSFCAPGAARNASGTLLPARCASTDILVGQKAKDLGTLKGDNITLGGKQAIKEIDRAPRNGQAELIYTVLVYDPSGTPLAGFSTSIGPGTDAATITNIVSMLDRITSTLVVDR
jgi:hypothetical protein